MILQKAIVNKNIVRIELEDKKIVIKPLSILYMHYDYWFTYEEDHEIETILLRDILSVKVLNLKLRRMALVILFYSNTHTLLEPIPTAIFY